MRPRRARSPRRSGFTFIEMMVVIAILSLMAALVVANLDGATARSQLSRSGRHLGNKLLFLRDLALVQARPLSLEIDLENSRWREVDIPSENEIPDAGEREELTFYGEWFEVGDGVVLDEIAFGRSNALLGDTFMVTFSERGELFPSGFVAYLRHQDINPDDGMSIEIAGLTGVVTYHRGRIEAEEIREEHDF